MKNIRRRIPAGLIASAGMAAMALVAHLSAGAHLALGPFSYVSDRNQKTDFQDISEGEILKTAIRLRS